MVPPPTTDKIDARQRRQFNFMLVGDDWFKNDRWRRLDQQVAHLGVRTIYPPCTRTSSSTRIDQPLAWLR